MAQIIETDIYTTLKSVSNDVWFNHAPHESLPKKFIIFRGIQSILDNASWCTTKQYEHSKRIQVDSYSTDALQAKGILYDAVSALTTQFNVTGLAENPDDIDEDTGLHRSSIDVTIRQTITL